MSRMWMLDPRMLCRNHLLGEHKELHQLVGCINAGRLNVIEGHAKLRQVDTTLIVKRHRELLIEIIDRGWRHKSPLPTFDDPCIGEGCIDLFFNLEDLVHRCSACAERWQAAPILNF